MKQRSQRVPWREFMRRSTVYEGQGEGDSFDLWLACLSNLFSGSPDTILSTPYHLVGIKFGKRL